MDLYSVKSDAMELKFDSGNGTLRELKNLSDSHGTNWIDPRFEWGKHYDAWADDQDFGLYYAVLRKL